FNSRVQVSLDGGSSFVYDTLTDSSLPNGFRFDGANRYLIWDIAGTGATVTGFATYDNLSVVLVPEPGTAILGLIGALVAGSFRRVRDKVR
ncbi:MAG TPA: PEP-CTERM sorting domain-containing protein, partial [Chthoniobacteraceae bacterium]|nr:PEP-CTERM sorting domain-containing protein [Chthoniobacteraceae bacterium]